MLCRTVALLSVPVIASIGHHTARTLLDEVAAVSCSTPPHAAEAAAPLNAVSATITQHAAQGASQAMLIATGLTKADLNKPQIGAPRDNALTPIIHQSVRPQA